jgi:hypothetical protein
MPWYKDPLGPLFVAGIPPEEQQRWQEVRLKVGEGRPAGMGRQGKVGVLLWEGCW